MLSGKKLLPVGQGEQFFDFKIKGLLDRPFGQGASNTLARIVLVHRKGTYFGQVFPAELKGAAACQFPGFGIFKYPEVSQVVV